MSVNYRCQLRFKTFSVNLIETERTSGVRYSHCRTAHV